MPERAAKRIALITGSSRRIGRAIALDLATNGWEVAIHYRNSTADAEQLIAEITCLGGSAQALRADLQTVGECEALVAACCQALGPPTCLINNASEFMPDTALTTSDATWCAHLDVNLKAPVFLSQAMVRHLPDGADGNIINIIDQRVWRLTPDFFSYTISKAGLWTATRTLAQALAPRIRVNAIAPGPTLKSVHQTEHDFELEQTDTLLERGPNLDEITAAVRFVLATPSMTGQMIALDGGQHLTWA